MTGLLFFLVFTLSGVPAAAIVCDLVFCEQPPAATHGCHDTSSDSDGVRLTSGASRCAHLAAVTLSVAPASRAWIDVIVAPFLPAIAAQFRIVDTRFADVSSPPGPPFDSVLPHRPLRI